jgi:beta-lactamase superfamily II metal-dependent hydrolase
MSIVKSFSVGDGDMFYIKHGTDNFTIIDCCLSDDNKKDIVDEIKREKLWKNITRFISTHPDGDHIQGLEYLDDEIKIINFYCVENEATKEDKTDDFNRYCELRDSDKAFKLYRECSRKWMNISDEERRGSGINILWPITSNEHYKDALEKTKEDNSPNNISIIVEYSLNDGVNMLWMGDLEKDFMAKIKDEITLPKIDILFAPHHGRKSGRVLTDWLDNMDPKIIVIGEADSEYLDYYVGYNTLTQNSACDITFECVEGKVHIYVSSDAYTVDFLDNENKSTFDNYIGTLNL